MKSHKALLKLAGAEPALQLAQLVALEHLLGVTLPERTKEVCSHCRFSCILALLCTGILGSTSPQVLSIILSGVTALQPPSHGLI